MERKLLFYQLSDSSNIYTRCTRHWYLIVRLVYLFPDTKVHGTNMGPTWVLSAPAGPLVGPMNLAIRVANAVELLLHYSLALSHQYTTIIFNLHFKFDASQGINSLWPSDALWPHRTSSTLVQVMACCMKAPSHDLNQCWFVINRDL